MNSQTLDQLYAPTPLSKRQTPASDLQMRDTIQYDQKNLLIREIQPLPTGQLRLVTLLGFIDSNVDTMFKRINRS